MRTTFYPKAQLFWVVVPVRGSVIFKIYIYVTALSLTAVSICISVSYLCWVCRRCWGGPRARRPWPPPPGRRRPSSPCRTPAWWTPRRTGSWSRTRPCPRSWCCPRCSSTPGCWGRCRPCRWRSPWSPACPEAPPPELVPEVTKKDIVQSGSSRQLVTEAYVRSEINLMHILHFRICQDYAQEHSNPGKSLF